MNMPEEMTAVEITETTLLNGLPVQAISDTALVALIQRERAKLVALESRVWMGSSRINAAAFALRESAAKLVKLFDERGDKA